MNTYIDTLISEIDSVIQRAQKEGIQLDVTPEDGSLAQDYQQQIKLASRGLYLFFGRYRFVEQKTFEKFTDALIRGAEVMNVSEEGIFQDQRVCGIVEMALNQDPPLTVPYRFEKYSPVRMQIQEKVR